MYIYKEQNSMVWTLYPGPAQLSVACSTVKRERAWYLFSHERRQDRKDGRKGLIVCGHTGLRTAKELLKYLVNYHTYLTSGRRLSYTPSVECVVGWIIRETQPVSSANFHNYVISCEKRYQALPLYRTSSDGSWVGPCYKVTQESISQQCNFVPP